MQKTYTYEFNGKQQEHIVTELDASIDNLQVALRTDNKQDMKHLMKHTLINLQKLYLEARSNSIK